MTVKQETQYQYLNRIAKENRYTINSLSREAGLSNSTIFYLKRRPLKKSTWKLISLVLPQIDLEYVNSLPTEADLNEIE